MMLCWVKHNGSCHMMLILTTVNQARKRCEIVMNDAYALVWRLNFRLANLISGTVCIWATKAECCEINHLKRKHSLMWFVEFLGNSVLVTHFCIASFYLILSLWCWQSGAQGNQRSKWSWEWVENGDTCPILGCGQSCIIHSELLLPARDIGWKWLMEKYRLNEQLVMKMV